MKSKLLTLLTMLSWLSLTAQTIPDGYTRVTDYDPRGFAAVRKGSKYGIVNYDGVFVVPCQFSAVGSFNPQGFVWVNKGGSCNLKNSTMVKGGKYGVYNSKGNVIVEPKFKKVGTFVNQKVLISKPFAMFNPIPDQYKQLSKEARGYDVFVYDYAEESMFSMLDMTLDSLIVISTTGQKQNDGIVRPDGSVMMPTGVAEFVYHPEENVVPVARVKNNRLYANYYLPESQSLMMTDWPEVDCLSSFFMGRAVLAQRNANRFIDKRGETIGRSFNIVIPSTKGSYILISDAKYGLANALGDVVVPTGYYAIRPAREGLMLAQMEKGGFIQYLNPDGSVALDTKYTNGTSFNHHSAAVCNADGWGIIDIHGHTIVRCKWYNIMIPADTACPLIWVRASETARFVCINSENDSIAFQGSFAAVQNFSQRFEGIAFVSDDGKHIGCINTKGEMVFPCVMDDLSAAVNEYQAMLKDGRKRWSERDLINWQKRQAASKKPVPVTEDVGSALWDY